MSMKMEILIKLRMTSEIIESHIESPFFCHRDFVIFVYLTLKPSDLIPTLIYVLMDNCCLCFISNCSHYTATS